MTNPAPQKISRRDAMKLLGAAIGATALANLPSKWSTPQFASGVLPAHAQTSVCWAVYVEFLASDGGYDAGFIPGFSAPSPDLITGMGGPGSLLGWVCQTGCLGFYVLLAFGTTGSVRITTASNQFTLNLDAGNPSYNILIDLGTGAYALNYAGSPGSCSWPQVPLTTQKQSDQNSFWQN